MFRKIFGATKAKKVSFVAGLAVALVSMFGVATLSPAPASATSACDGTWNDVLYKGFSDRTDFINKTKSGSDSYPHHDLQAIYNVFGLSSNNYDDFAANAVVGKSMHSDNTIRLSDGTIVATAASSYGRNRDCQGSGAFTKTGTPLWGNVNSKSTVSDIPVLLYFNDNGELQFAVMNICGNPSSFTSVKNTSACKALSATADANNPLVYNMTTDAPVSGNAAIAKVVYDCGNGTTVESNTPTKASQCKYDKPGDYTTKVTVYVSLPGGKSKKIEAAGDCIKVIHIMAPECTVLKGAFIDEKNKLNWRLTVTSSATGGAKLKDADFDFGDTTTKTGVLPNPDGTTATVEHLYAKAGNYDVKAMLHFTVGDKTITADTCALLITPEGSHPECKPNIPEGDARCTPCKYDSSLPNTPEKCVPPELPNTGAGNTIAIFAVVMIGGFLVYRQLLFRKHKSAFEAAQFGTSPLPLGDPLSDEAPLAGTPLAPKKLSFRRKRHF